jgi:hypothetical protein
LSLRWYDRWAPGQYQRQLQDFFFTIALTSLFWGRLAIISQSLFDLALCGGNEI